MSHDGHAACFTMALANELAEAGRAAQDLDTDARATLRPVDGRSTITQIQLSTTGIVPGIDQGTFAAHASSAKAGCPVSERWPVCPRSAWRQYFADRLGHTAVRAPSARPGEAQASPTFIQSQRPRTATGSIQVAATETHPIVQDGSGSGASLTVHWPSSRLT